MVKDKKCADLVKGAMLGRVEDLKALWEAEKKGHEQDPDLGYFHEYGLSFDYVPMGTFEDQQRAYWRYQISYGGPSEEFRFYADSFFNLEKIEFWYLNWFDGACVELDEDNEALMGEIWDYFKEGGSVEAAVKAAE